MKQYEQFSACLKRVLEKQGLSASQVAKELGLRSRNSIFRILTDQTSVKVKEEFFHVLRSCYEEKWPQCHWHDLEEALTLDRLGLVDYLGRKALHSLIEKDERYPEILLNVPLQGCGYSTHTLRERVQNTVMDGKLIVNMCGCCSPALCNLMKEELEEPGRQGRVRVRHFVNMREDNAVRNVVAIQPLLYFNWYEPLLVEPGSCPEEMEAVYSANTIILEKIDDDGKRYYCQMIMHSSDRLYLVTLHENGTSDIVKLLNSYSSKLSKLKLDFPGKARIDDYVQYTERFRLLEQKREILSLKPDVPINFIHPDIFVPVVMEGLRETDLVSETELSCYIRKFYDIHQRRFDNIFNKRKVTHVVFSLSAMRNFMLTGERSDPFIVTRPYTLVERLAILNHLRDASANNPYFSIRFLKPEHDHPSMEITLYEGEGVVFKKPGAQHELSGDHAEALVSHGTLAKKYREFFIHDLLQNHVMSHKESLAALGELAREAAKFG